MFNTSASFLSRKKNSVRSHLKETNASSRDGPGRGPTTRRDRPIGPSRQCAAVSARRAVVPLAVRSARYEPTTSVASLAGRPRRHSAAALHPQSPSTSRALGRSGPLNPRARRCSIRCAPHPTQVAAAMEDEEMEKKVQQYLQRKGFRASGSPS
ncbi:hypothetical protein PVAP13_4NG257711 [Panicum virgatum]|uniref:Uncharacterized protein n=1 Tax=Panicum virgatum TaxID=38727 RepID=A0A8T0T838_PANVG|nr:hypothetical protein PVAP13_4NG257711 [Panicum virgatum]